MILSAFFVLDTFSHTFLILLFYAGFSAKGKPRGKPIFVMNATISVICYKSKTLAIGEHPLMVRIAKSGKRTDQSLGISIYSKYWDFKQNRPKRNYPNKEEIENLITAKKNEFRKSILELNTTQKDYAVESLKDKIGNPKTLKTVNQVFLEYIDNLYKSNRMRYADSCKLGYNSIIRFNKHLNIYFSEIDLSWLRKYESWLHLQRLANRTIGIRYRTLRTIYNYAIAEKHASSECYSFKAFKVSKFQQATAKRSLTKSDVNKVINYETSNKRLQLAIDIFTFSYLMAGINFVDTTYIARHSYATVLKRAGVSTLRINNLMKL